MYTIQPDYDGMLADYLDEISAADYEESRQAAEALRLEKEYRSAIIREWAEVSIADGKGELRPQQQSHMGKLDR